MVKYSAIGIIILIAAGFAAYLFFANKPSEDVAGNVPSAGKIISQKTMQWSKPPEMEIDTAKKYTAEIVTSAGAMKVELFASENPVTVNNFVFLSKQGFYDGTRFHRIIKGFMIQGGDPGGDGTGGPGYKFDDEPITREYERGIVAMANSGANTNGSQFFIMHQAVPLQKNYVIFGKVIEGLGVLDALAETPVRTNAQREASVPTKDVIVKSVTIEEK